MTYSRLDPLVRKFVTPVACILSLAVPESLSAAALALSVLETPPNDGSQPAEEPGATPVEPEADSLPNYSGNWSSREYLAGDWGGRRTELAAAGLTIDFGWTQIGQGVVSGGRRIDWDYGGNLDLQANADLEALWKLPGSLWFRGESRYGETVNDDAGAFTPVNTRGYFPLAGDVNEGIPFTITELGYSLPLGDTLELSLGKFLTVEGDPVEFAGGMGRTQFLNSNFIYNATTSQTAPYSTLGVAVDWFPDAAFMLSNSLFATTDSSTTPGFETLDDGFTWSVQAEFSYRIGSLPGGVNAGGLFAFDNEFAKIGGRLSLIPGGGVAAQTVSDSWAIYAGAWQYLATFEEVPDEIDASDEHADVRGLGLFVRIGFADPDANPIDWSASIGFGGRGLIPQRGRDTFGAGYYYTSVQDGPLFSLAGIPSSTQGFEAFYNIALTPAAGLTLDVQWIDEGLESLDPATIIGARLHIDF